MVPSDLREPGMAGQKQVSVFSHVETTGGMGQANIPVGESYGTHTVLSVKLHSFCTCLGLRRNCSLKQ